MRMTKVDSARLFLDWIEKRYPGSRAKIIRKAGVPAQAPQLAGLGQWPSVSFPGAWPGSPSPTVPFPSGVAQPGPLPTPQPEWWEKLASAAAQVVPAYYQYKTQDKITDAQIERMKNGYAPIDDPTSYMPAFRVQHEVNPNTIRQSFALDKDTKTVLYVGGAALLALFLMRNRNAEA